MKLGVYTVLFSDQTLEEILIYLSAKGIQVGKLGAGGYSGTAHGRFTGNVGGVRSCI